MKLLKDEYEKQMENLKSQYDLSMKRLSNEIEKLQSEKHSLLAELDTNNNQRNQVNYAASHMNVKSNRSNMSSSNGGRICFTGLFLNTFQTCSFVCISRACELAECWHIEHKQP